MSALVKVDLPYVNSFRSQHGKMRFYFRRKGCKRIALPHPDDPGFLAAYKAALGEPERATPGITPTADETALPWAARFMITMAPAHSGSRCPRR